MAFVQKAIHSCIRKINRYSSTLKISLNYSLNSYSLKQQLRFGFSQSSPSSTSLYKQIVLKKNFYRPWLQNQKQIGIFQEQIKTVLLKLRALNSKYAEFDQKAQKIKGLDKLTIAYDLIQQLLQAQKNLMLNEQLKPKLFRFQVRKQIKKTLLYNYQNLDQKYQLILNIFEQIQEQIVNFCIIGVIQHFNIKEYNFLQQKNVSETILYWIQRDTKEYIEINFQIKLKDYENIQEVAKAIQEYLVQELKSLFDLNAQERFNQFAIQQFQTRFSLDKTQRGYIFSPSIITSKIINSVFRSYKRRQLISATSKMGKSYSLLLIYFLSTYVEHSVIYIESSNLIQQAARIKMNLQNLIRNSYWNKLKEEQIQIFNKINTKETKQLLNTAKLQQQQQKCLAKIKENFLYFRDRFFNKERYNSKNAQDLMQKFNFHEFPNDLIKQIKLKELGQISQYLKFLTSHTFDTHSIIVIVDHVNHIQKLIYQNQKIRKDLLLNLNKQNKLTEQNKEKTLKNLLQLAITKFIFDKLKNQSGLLFNKRFFSSISNLDFDQILQNFCLSRFQKHQDHCEMIEILFEGEFLKNQIFFQISMQLKKQLKKNVLKDQQTKKKYKIFISQLIDQFYPSSFNAKQVKNIAKKTINSLKMLNIDLQNLKQLQMSQNSLQKNKINFTQIQKETFKKLLKDLFQAKKNKIMTQIYKKIQESKDNKTFLQRLFAILKYSQKNFRATNIDLIQLENLFLKISSFNQLHNRKVSSLNQFCKGFQNFHKQFSQKYYQKIVNKFSKIDPLEILTKFRIKQIIRLLNVYPHASLYLQIKKSIQEDIFLQIALKKQITLFEVEKYRLSHTFTYQQKKIVFYAGNYCQLITVQLKQKICEQDRKGIDQLCCILQQQLKNIELNQKRNIFLKATHLQPAFDLLLLSLSKENQQSSITAQFIFIEIETSKNYKNKNKADEQKLVEIDHKVKKIISQAVSSNLKTSIKIQYKKIGYTADKYYLQKQSDLIPLSSFQYENRMEIKSLRNKWRQFDESHLF